MTVTNRCPQCMKQLENGEKVCSACGFNSSSVQPKPYLPFGTVLKGRYIVGKMIKKTVDSAVYLAFDTLNSKTIEIREFFPLPIAERGDDGVTLSAKNGFEEVYSEYLHSFVQLWRNLMRFRGLPALFDVNDLITCFGTGYAVTDHNDGTTFRKVLDSADISNHPFTLRRTKELIVPMLSTVESLHTANVVHRGISPETLILTSDGKLKIVGFAISQVRSTKNTALNSVHDGYSAVEQYGFNWQQGAWTDIYSIGALIYKLLTGRDLKSAPERLNDPEVYFTDDEKKRIPESVRSLITRCLEVMPQQRVKTIAEIRDVFVPFESKPSSVTRIATPTDRQSNAVRVRTNDREKLPEKPKKPEIVKPKQAVPVTKTAQSKSVTISERERLEELEKKEELKREQERRAIEEEERRRREAEEMRIRLQREAEMKRQLKTRKKQEKQAKQENSKIAQSRKKLTDDIKNKIEKERQKPRNPIVLGVTIAISIALVGVLTVMLLYGTVLYKVFDAPSLDNALSVFSFLPINSDREDEDDVTYVSVPNFYELTKEYIESNSAYLRKYNIVFEYDYCDTVKAGYVFSQSVKAEEKVPMGTTVTVYISKGIEMITMIDVGDMKIDEATAQLEAIGFAVNKVEKYNNGFKRTGYITDYSLIAGEEYPKGTEVTVSYWGKPLVTTQPPTSEGEQNGTTQPGTDISDRWGLFSLLERIFGN